MVRINAYVVLVVFICALAGKASATSVTGSIFGQVVDQQSGGPISGVTVIATGPQGDQGAVTGEDGRYELRSLAVGAYVVRFYYGDVTVEQPQVLVSVDKTVRLNGRIPTAQVTAEVVRVQEKAPAVDVGSSRVSTTLNEDFARHVPNTLTVGGMLEKAPGAYLEPIVLATGQQSMSLSLGGATGAENSYILDGVPVTSIGYGLLATDIMGTFVDEVEVISAGYDAEYGRSLSGVVNIVTKSGSNELKGSAFGFVSPRWLSTMPRRLYSRSTSLTAVTQPSYTTNVGAEVGGPILKDRLFFWLGYAPEIGSSRTTRFADRFIDADGDGVQDTVGGHPAVEEIYRSRFSGSSLAHQYSGKLTLLPTATRDHTLSLGVYGIHRADEYLSRANQDPRAAMSRDKSRSNDISARWLSKFFERRWQLEANVGLHAEGNSNQSPYEDMREVNGVFWQTSPSLTQFDPQQAVLDACKNDPTTGFQSCPVQEYRSGGYDFGHDISALRLATQVKSTHLFRAGGWHQLKYGADYELNQYEDNRGFSGPDGGHGRIMIIPGDGQDMAMTLTMFRLKPGERAYLRQDGDFMDPDTNMDGKRSDLLTEGWYQDVLRSKTETHNTSVFLQDGYSPLPNLTFNVGMRWEAQQIQDAQGGTPIRIYDSFAPRLGAVYDPTNEGRSKIYTHWGRFYESIPLDLNSRAFGGEGVLVAVHPEPSLCGQPFSQWGGGQAATTWKSCDRTPLPEAATLFPLAGENLLVQKKIKGAHSDEVVLGAQYELFQDLTIGAAYIRRTLGRMVEDAAGIVANPGDIPKSVLDDLEADAVAKEAAATPAGATAGQQAAAQEARFLADAAAQVAEFPKPKRDYNALQMTVAKRFSANWLLQSSYTYSRTKGNFPGLYAADTGQLDPNYTSQYDLADLLLNREGPLPNDRPHLFRADGYYRFEVGRSTLTTGLGFMAMSGRPMNTQGTHMIYGPGETFILPRGSAGRTPVVTRFDLHLGYRVKLTDGTSLDAFVDLFNVFNQRTALTRDSKYTLDPVDPIVGGDKSDLAHLKNAFGGPVTPNPNYLAATSYQAPIAGRLGLRLSF